MSVINLEIKPDKEDIEAAEVYVKGIIGSKKYRFILDTGSAKTYVQFDDYTSTFDSFQKNNTSGVFAERNDDLITVPYIELGPISKRNFTIARSSQDSSNTRNLIGMDLLKDFCLHFLFEKDRVLVDNLKDFSTNENLQELILGKKYHPYIYVQFENVKATAVWDTGAGITVADINFIRKNPLFFEEIGKSKGIDSTGTKIETPMFTMQTAIIGDIEFPSHTVAGVDLSHVNSTTEIPMDLILGYSTLSKANWVFDFPNEKWAILKMLNKK